MRATTDGSTSLAQLGLSSQEVSIHVHSWLGSFKLVIQVPQISDSDSENFYLHFKF